MPFEDYNNIYIEDKGEYSKLCLAKDLSNLGDLLSYIQKLPYGRNSNKEKLQFVFEEAMGTCGTKHAFLYEVIKEQEWNGWDLILGLYIIDSENTEEAEGLLIDSGILEVPNAHVYLKYKGEIVDASKKGSENLLFKNRLIKEEKIDSNQISNYKAKFLKNYVKEWYQQSELGCSFSYKAVLDLREQILFN